MTTIFGISIELKAIIYHSSLLCVFPFGSHFHFRIWCIDWKAFDVLYYYYFQEKTKSASIAGCVVVVGGASALSTYRSHERHYANAGSESTFLERERVESSWYLRTD